MKRRAEAVTSKFTDVIGPQTNKARALSAGEQQGQRAVVNSLKPTGASAINTRASLTPTYPSDRTQSKLAFLLLLHSLGRARHGANNERSTASETSPGHQRVNRRLLDPLD